MARREAEGRIKVTQPLSGGRAWLQPPLSPGGPLSAAGQTGSQARPGYRTGPAPDPGPQPPLSAMPSQPFLPLSCDPEQPHLRSTKLPACVELGSRKSLPRLPWHARLARGSRSGRNQARMGRGGLGLTAPGPWAPERPGARDKGQGRFAALSKPRTGLGKKKVPAEGAASKEDVSES